MIRTLRLTKWGLGWWLGALLLGLTALPGQAQHENDIWYFGNRAGLSFATGGAAPLTNGALVSGEACASVADAQGNLLFYTNGISVWNRQHQVMPNGGGIGGFTGTGDWPPNSATQGALIVPRPGSAAQYYVFTVDAAENNLAAGLQYAVVDLSAQGGLGEVISQRARLPTPTLTSRVTEKLAGLRHPNGVDTWVLVHGWENNLFMAFRVSAAGVAAAPVVSAVGAVHQGGGGIRDAYNALGYLKFSPDGRRLAVLRYGGAAELFDFDPLTGAVSNPRTIATGSMYGAEFSPSGQMLYLSDLAGITQLDLRTGTSTVVSPFPVRDDKGALLLGPDNRIYLTIARQAGTLATIDFPELPGALCGYQPRAIALGRDNYLGLPNPVVVPRPVSPGPYLGFTYTNDCRGLTLSFTAGLLPAAPGATYRWDFGEPTSPSNTATGPTAAHTFARFGTYRVTLQAQLPGPSAPVVATTTVSVAAPPAADLGPPVRLLCPGADIMLAPRNAPYPATFLWDVGLSSPTRLVNRPGLYWLQITDFRGCVTRDSVRVYSLDQARLNVRADTAVCSTAPVPLRVQPRLPGARYRWSTGSTADSLVVTQPGVYWVEVRGDSASPASCVRRLTRIVNHFSNCNPTPPPPVPPSPPPSSPPLAEEALPNVITPNGDGQNDAFELRGWNAAAWRCRVFNRWGRLVFQADSYANDWGPNAPSGVYYYELTERQTGQRLKGTVEVLR